ncbi:bifunctional glycosyltransferase/CDP-glycerol:glycerophosphate glycerophosphotransferase [Streptomyces caniscabiei]|uniref:bifunctional glycosyltransferase/CDP-glycerol:glycerophosphate glycerophosphotransferase n=1 Tax=Streptomyces caniscabiei TaxID=2746961 RepID=UPI001CE1DEE6|nr:bifunctional glycosyltransferase family 2 protein/CDP-glycerol:glycerophosphate glycerophosphotransferase [Streptomyces caniscabiei]MDX3730283.1 bifunctional glycosyltransferase family 2 protein/CDP-glycerol:glycerophosphate glycerophosphotransferase [Streptomyces caniscabiei]
MSPLPRFSVIVPAYKVQAYLHECLDSVLSQSFTDLEVIVVDDASPDNCAAITDEFAAHDPRVRRTVRLRENAGPGAARNKGMEYARGDYLLFLDADDTFTPGALQAIADRVKETGEPDVLVHGFARVSWSGEPVHDARDRRLTEQGPAPFRLDDRPGLLTVRPAAWNKACKREFVEDHDFRFPPGAYEDTAWSYPVLMAAESVATLDRVCVHHRRRRHGSLLGTTTHSHFDVFGQYDRVFAYVDERPELAQWRPVLFRRMVDHLTSVFSGGHRLPREARAEFLRMVRAHCVRYRTPGAPLRARARLRHALLRLGSPRLYRALWAGARLGRGAGRLARGLAGLFRGGGLRLHYRVQRLLPLRADRAVFAAYGGRGYECSPAALENAFRTYVPSMRTSWVARPEHHHTLPVGTRRVLPGSMAYWTALARSKYLVNNADFDRRLVKRRGQVLLQTQHGTPLKHMGIDLRDRPAAARGRDFEEVLRGSDQWDYVLSGNRHSTLVWERVYPSPFTILEYGSPRNDVLLSATSADVARVREHLGVPEGAVAVLYAPTHRDYRHSQRAHLDLERVLRKLGPRFVVLARAHHAYDSPLTDLTHGRLLDVTGYPSVENLCLASDALITDYSSLMFDYANLDRPIVIHAEDWEAYEAARGTYFDLRSCAPGAVARSEDELIDIFATGHWRGSRSAQLRAAFRERFCPYDDGRAAERVVRRVVLGECVPSGDVVPLGERHPVPSAASARAGAADELLGT